MPFDSCASSPDTAASARIVAANGVRRVASQPSMAQSTVQMAPAPLIDQVSHYLCRHCASSKLRQAFLHVMQCWVRQKGPDGAVQWIERKGCMGRAAPALLQRPRSTAAVPTPGHPGSSAGPPRPGPLDARSLLMQQQCITSGATRQQVLQEGCQQRGAWTSSHPGALQDCSGR